VRTLAAIFVVGLMTTEAACTVPAGARPDAGDCHPSPDYFAGSLWLPYIDANQCATSGCHAFADGHGYLRYVPPGSPPAPSTPLDEWPAAWQTNYAASIPFVRCDAPEQSRLLTVPAGLADPHPVGVRVEDVPFATTLFDDWIATP
jgi:hypothetical protein